MRFLLALLSIPGVAVGGCLALVLIVISMAISVVTSIPNPFAMVGAVVQGVIGLAITAVSIAVGIVVLPIALLCGLGWGVFKSIVAKAFAFVLASKLGSFTSRVARGTGERCAEGVEEAFARSPFPGFPSASPSC